MKSVLSYVFSSSVASSLCQELLVWIDALCINQGDDDDDDDDEKSQQVSQINSVYSLAEEVILWLG
jgi:Heterokaryon incompatibility protein (HET)